MSVREEVLAAVKALIVAALPDADVRGMTVEDAKASQINAGGEVLIGSGDPGPAEIDLSPPLYWYDHTIPIGLTARTTAQRSEMLARIDAAMRADRTLGGLCSWLDAEAPNTGEMDVKGAVALPWADFPLIATYSTDSPLG